MRHEDKIRDAVNEIRKATVAYNQRERVLQGKHRPALVSALMPHFQNMLHISSDAPRLAVEVLAEVLKVSGFRLTGSEDSDAESDINERLSKWWALNRMEMNFRLAVNEALGHGNAYFIVAPSLEDTSRPRITAHPSRDFYIMDEDLEGVHEALHVFKRDEHGEASGVMYYTDSEAIEYRLDTGGKLTEVFRTPTAAGKCYVVNMANLIGLGGQTRSEFDPIMPLADAESRTLTMLQHGQDQLIWPRRFLFGNFGEDGPFTTPQGEVLDSVSAYLGAVWTGPEGANAGQFTQASLDPILDAVRMYRLLISASSGIPPALLGVSADAPSSAEAMRASKERLISLGEAKQDVFGDALIRVMKLAWANAGMDGEELEQLDVVWRDIASASISARNATMMSAYQLGAIGGETAREFLDLSPEQRARERAREKEVEAQAGWMADAYGQPEYMDGERPVTNFAASNNPAERTPEQRADHAKEQDRRA